VAQHVVGVAIVVHNHAVLVLVSLPLSSFRETNKNTLWTGKCGKFANNAAPSSDECAAANVCGVTEYCDATLERCVPLDPGNLACGGNAVLPSQDEVTTISSNLNQLPLCGDCNRTLGLLNVVNNTCLATIDATCGQSATKCRVNQRCFGGKCRCDGGVITSPGAYAFGWNEYLNRDIDRDNKLDINGMPATGCDDSVISSMLEGFYGRAMMSFIRFTECVSRGSNVTSITPPDLRNTSMRELACTGQSGQCPLAYCNALIGNLTGFERSDFCGVAKDSANQFKRCAQGYVFSGETIGDLDCANPLAKLTAQSQPQDFTWIDLYSFLECEGPKQDFVFHFAKAQRGKTFLYRSVTAQQLLGASSLVSVSMVIALSVTLVQIYFA